MSVKGPVRSAGICQRFDDFSELDNRCHEALTIGLKGNKLNFTLLLQGILNDPDVQDAIDRALNANPQAGAYRTDPRTGKTTPVPVAYPQEQKRDDLEQQFASKFKPRPF